MVMVARDRVRVVGLRGGERGWEEEEWGRRGAEDGESNMVSGERDCGGECDESNGCVGELVPTVCAPDLVNALLNCYAPSKRIRIRMKRTLEL